MKRTGPTNEHTSNLIGDLYSLAKKEKAKIWKRVAEELNRPTRKRREVNIFRINFHTKDNETIIVPGKVLGNGELDHKVNVAAWNFSETAKKKIISSGKAMSISELIKENPKGNRVRIIG